MANPELAKALLAAASSIDPYSRNRIGNLAGALSAGLGTYQQAQQQGQQQRDIAAIGGQGAERYKALAQYWADKDPAKAKQYLDLAASLSPQKPKAFGQTANINGRLMQLTESGESIDLGPAPAEKPNLPTGVQEYEYAKQQGFKGSLLDYERQKAAAGRAPSSGPSPTLLTTVGPDGKPRYELVAPGQLPSGAPLSSVAGAQGAATEDERKAAGWYTAATNALQVIKNIGQEAGTPTATQALLGELPSFGIGESIASALRSDKKRQYDQAMATASDAILRAATGAGQNEGEVKRKLQELTPQYLDSDTVKAQKLAGLESYVESLKYRAGRALPKDQSAPQPTPPKIKRYNPATGRIE